MGQNYKEKQGKEARLMVTGRSARTQGGRAEEGHTGHFKSHNHIPSLELGGVYTNVHGARIFYT